MQFFLAGLLFLGGLFGSQMLSYDSELEGMPKEKPTKTFVKTLINGDKTKRFLYKSGQTCVMIKEKSLFSCTTYVPDLKNLPVINKEAPSSANPEIYTFGYADGLNCELSAAALSCVNSKAEPAEDTKP